MCPPDGLSNWDWGGSRPSDGCQCLSPFCAANGLVALLKMMQGGPADLAPDCGPRSALEGGL